MLNRAVQSGRVYKLLSATAAFLLWGGWAWYVNGSDLSRPAVVSGMTQGTCSFAITLILVYLIGHLRGYFAGAGARLFVPPLLTVLATTGVLALIHWSISTPQLVVTILPASVVALLFSLFTSFKLHKPGAHDG